MYKVLIVDDEQLIRSGMIARFQHLNFTFESIREAASGVEALALLEKEPADIIITDIKMPDMDGLEETRQIRALDRPDARTVPIIAMTANLFEQDIKACKDAGMTGFLAKPLNIGQLLSTILQQVKGRKA